MNIEQDLSSSEIKEFNKQLEYLSYGTIEITPENEFHKMLAHSIKNNKPLRVKCGIDPTTKDVHLGHSIPYRKMRQFQELGHKGVVIIGDYTAQIGDPTGKEQSRPSLSKEDVKQNAETYMQQVSSILLMDNTEIKYQSEWFEKVNLLDLMSWAKQTTVAKLLSHETFSNRLDNEQSLGLHELFYPVLQGIDSVYIKADVELGGSDQKFNVLMGRDYQKLFDLRPQVAMLLPIILGVDGKQKMSKSLNNYIAINDEPFDKFGKLMSIPDELMSEYATYLSSMDQVEFQKFIGSIKDGSLHPNEGKKQLAVNIVAYYHGQEIALKMREQFEKVFAQKKLPDEIEEYNISTNKDLLTILIDQQMIKSKSEGRRLIKQNAISIVDGEKITDAELIIDQNYKNKVIKIGKRRFLKFV
jgi:tyrosyl-tRNA synthetase